MRDLTILEYESYLERRRHGTRSNLFPFDLFKLYSIPVQEIVSVRGETSECDVVRPSLTLFPCDCGSSPLWQANPGLHPGWTAEGRFFVDGVAPGRKEVARPNRLANVEGPEESHQARSTIFVFRRVSPDDPVRQ